MKRTRVLLVDDHIAMCKSVASLLEPDFDVVGMVANGKEMLLEAARLKPDVVILDISMPILDGIAAAQQLFASDSQAKVVFLTVHQDVEFLQAGLKAGALGYVLKYRLAIDLATAVQESLVGRMFVSPGIHKLDKQRSEQT